MKVFVVHYHKLTERKTAMNETLMHNNIQAEFVEHYDRDTLTPEDDVYFYNKYEIMSNPVKAVALSHMYCYREIADKYDYALILEDDTIFCDDFTSKLNNYMAQLPPDWDMLFIGDGCGFHIPADVIKSSSSNIFRKGPEPTSWGGDGATRCTDSYIVSKKCAQGIIGYKEKIGRGVDWWLNQVIRDCKFNVYWAEPTLVTQGSQNSLYKTSWM